MVGLFCLLWCFCLQLTSPLSYFKWSLFSGLYRRCFARTQYSVLILGLDFAGKTVCVSAHSGPTTAFFADLSVACPFTASLLHQTDLAGTDEDDIQRLCPFESQEHS